jgi:DNA excision repair protein ERCC-4
MTATSRSATDISEYLSTLDLEAPAGTQGRVMMEKRLHKFLWWKAKLAELMGEKTSKTNDPRSNATQKQGGANEGLSEALKKKDRDRKDRAANRRRIRGAAAGAVASSNRQNVDSSMTVETMNADMVDDTETIADL